MQATYFHEKFKMCELQTTEQKFVRGMKDTARSRFKAHRRLLRMEQKLTRITALSSSLVIALTVMPYIFQGPVQIANLINFVAICVSIIILIASLLQYSNQNSIMAEQHHRSALEINELIRIFELKQNPSEEDFNNLAKNYNFLLQKYSVNHEEEDYHQVVIERRHENLWVSDAKVKKIERAKFWSEMAVDGWVTVIAMLFVLTLAWAIVGPILIRSAR